MKQNKNLTKWIRLISGSLIFTAAAVLSFFIIGSIFDPFQAEKEQERIYLVSGETARTSIKFYNTSGTSKKIQLSFGKNNAIEKTIPGNSSKQIPLDFGSISEDTDITVKYGFLKRSSVQIHVTAVRSHEIGVQSADIRITDEDGTDLTQKKYCPPNKKIVFQAACTNSSGKDFEREYQMRVSDGTVQTKKVKWHDSNRHLAILKFDHTFKKQGYYKVRIGNSDISITCAANDPPPSNGSFLLRRVSAGRGQMKIENHYNYPVIVTLCKKSSPDKAQNRIYLKKKSSASMPGIEDGTYIIYIKAGSGYNRMLKDILDPSVAYKFTLSMKFTTTRTKYSIWRIKLGTQGGNARTVPIDKNNIPVN